MPVLRPGEPLDTKGPVLEVENALKPGAYRFRLVVVNAAGAESDPAVVEVVVRERLAPPVRVAPTPGRVAGRKKATKQATAKKSTTKRVAAKKAAATTAAKPADAKPAAARKTAVKQSTAKRAPARRRTPKPRGPDA